MKQITLMMVVALLATNEGKLYAQTIAPASAGRKKNALPEDWHMRVPLRDSVFGAAIIDLYPQLAQKRTSAPVVVAILDTGLDTAHPDLRTSLWVNTKEIPGNGLDDDGNNYVDDVHGWNFLGSADGSINHMVISTEPDREYVRLQKLVATRRLSREELGYLDRIRSTSKLFEQEQAVANAKKVATQLEKIQRMLITQFKDSVVTYAQWQQVITSLKDSAFKNAVMVMRFRSINQQDSASRMPTPMALAREIQANAGKAYERQMDLATRDYHRSVNDYSNSGKMYGNNKVFIPGSAHGTQVAGIIGASRNNGIGMDGIAMNVQLMALRVIPATGDEFDEDVAHAIRYAVDNGASIINMSFGKLISPGKTLVDEAIRYAAQKNVLIIHAAGNDGFNTDSAAFYPTVFFADGSRAPNIITVGGTDNKGSITGFSNWGERSVDIFAPSHDIYTTSPGKYYGRVLGTSFAAPIVTGVAALLKNYYPALKAAELRDIICNSSFTLPQLAGKSAYAGIINAFNAFQMAEKINKY